MAVARDSHRTALPDHVPAHPDPARPRELQPQPARLTDGGGQAASERDRLQEHQRRPRPPGECRQPAQPVSHPGARDCGIPSVGQVHDQQVHGAGSEQRGGQDQALRQIRRGQHDEPLQADPAGHRLHGIEGAGEVQPGDDPARRLRLGGDPQRDGGPAGRGVPAHRDGAGTRQPARAQNGVQRREPRGDDAAIIGERLRPNSTRSQARHQARHRGHIRSRRLERHRRPGQCSLDHRSRRTTPPGGGRPPARLERGKGRGDVRRACHRAPDNRTYVRS